ncbi:MULTISPECIES: flagellar biosynthesis protein FlhA [Shewanella]|uniref:flagellar biosynthesis protein FlhA n=1 Tax=Shewanella TaxID=22 RepID=UPI0011823401|nr:flagellar biosynthesis protein FlhA [Shewanella algae]EKT4487929.1 flagellar biosynthesis protein FlhA [Shewanella algae]MBO2550232.1 flagellar biosynthesis protein FlhA [Shewanella algae]MBO2554565.1 flagellar biosynthesis protein FlhA [Shewanella algae]MBO2672882.1 flagellar biosynthesis protein FlhA [Shewanella algae]MCE9784067.1 flagellar biosynthesis protein FlhA [Shewanella algae]
MNWLRLLTANKSHAMVPLLLLTLMAMIILPLPPWLLDVMFTFNIVLAIMVLLVSVSIRRPLDFSIFPTLLLLATLLRLTLNVASTRVVLIRGHEGGDAAGKVIQAFGEVVIGGNYVVGAVVFLILMIINFVVITKGGERISEVSARFTLDALPGKQMAIDADLNAGLLTQDQARERRKEVAAEADFYGSMDGASKFVRGDAIAGLLILAINIIGGICIGIFMHDLSGTEAFKTYALLTIGDGLVAQIPSLLLATAAAIVVTRVSDAEEMPAQFNEQLLANPKTLATAALVMLIMGLVPGMPTWVFLSAALLLGFVAYKQYRTKPTIMPPPQAKQAGEALSEPQAPSWDSLPYVDAIEVKLGYRLVSLVEKERGAELMKRLTGIRRTLSEQAGYLLPEVRVRDNLALSPTHYQISIMGTLVATAELDPERLLAIRSSNVFGELDGIITRDPAYNMEAVWIEQEKKANALNLGYSVVDNATVIATHVAKLLRERMAELLQHDDVISLNERLARQAPKLAESLSQALSPIQQLKVYRLLLREQVSLRDILTIGTTLLDCSENSKDPVLLAADVRCALRQAIVQAICGDAPQLKVMTLTPELERQLMSALSTAQQQGSVSLDGFPVDPQLLAQLQQKMPQLLAEAKAAGHHPILLVPPQLRPLLGRYALAFSRGLNVLSYNEISENKDIMVAGQLG